MHSPMRKNYPNAGVYIASVKVYVDKKFLTGRYQAVVHDHGENVLSSSCKNTIFFEIHNMKEFKLYVYLLVKVGGGYYRVFFSRVKSNLFIWNGYSYPIN